MNKIYLFGKIVSKSKLKYDISPKLKIYLEIVIETISGEQFNCVVLEDNSEKLQKLGDLSYVYIIGIGAFEKQMFKVIVSQIHTLY